MNVLFLTLLDINSLNDGNIYSDLLSVFAQKGDNVYIVSPIERRYKKPTHVIQNGNVTIVRNKILNIQKTNLIEKGLSTLMVESKIKKAIKKYFKGIKFDLVLYSTPPVTFAGVISYLKKTQNPTTYLLLKDIFPQNCVDLGLFGKKSIFYKFFAKKEKKLYALSDYIGCMSPANVKFILENNKLDSERVEVCPNSERLSDNSISEEERKKIREKYGIPQDKIVFCYGGNLGRPQGIDFFIECLKSCKDDRFFFLIAGKGTDSYKIEEYVSSCKPDNVKYISALPKKEYEKLVACADVGLILLDKRFTIPNFPSRVLSYLKAKLPVMCVTDKNSDMGDIAEQNGFGVKAISDNVENFLKALEKFSNICNNIIMGQAGYNYFANNWDVEKVYPIIASKVKGEDK